MKKTLSVLLLLVLCMSLCTSALALEAGDVITFGSYHQDIPGQPIEWRVLAVYGTTAVLLSEKVLDCTHYDRDNAHWESSHMFQWLNEKFYARAFSASERKALIRNEYGVYVTLPTVGDLTNEAFGFLPARKAEDQARRAEGTQHAEDENLNRESFTNYAPYFTSSPYEGKLVFIVRTDGTLTGARVNCNDVGARPLIYVDTTKLP